MPEHDDIEARDYQVTSRDRAFAAWAGGVASTLLVLPTGTGKTVVAGMVCVQVARERGWKTLYIAHREELITQAVATLRIFGLDVAIEMGPHDAFTQEALLGRADVVVGTVQTMQDVRLYRWPTEAFGLVIMDEAHHATAPSYRNVRAQFPDALLLGITATPDGSAQGNLGGVFQTKCFEYPLRQAIEEGWLARIVTKTCLVPVDLRAIRTTGDDFNKGDLEERIAPRLQAIAAAIVAEHEGRQTVAFTPDVGSALGLAQMLTALGMPSEYVAGTGGAFGMSKPERKDALARFKAGAFAGLVNCDLLVEGWDCPQVACIAIVRPTRKRHRYCQMVGRGTRRALGKLNLLVLDFDWQTDESSKDLCGSIDLYDDGTLDPEVAEAARRLTPTGTFDPAKVIDQAEIVIRRRRTLKLQVNPTLAAEYRTITRDPVGIGKLLDIPLRTRYDLDPKGKNPASPQQVGFLRSLGMVVPEVLSKWGASKMIDKLLKRKTAGLATVGQVHALLAAGVDPDLARAMTTGTASGALQELQAAQGPVQGSLFS